MAIWTRAQALALLPPGQVRGLVYDGAWQIPFPGTLCDGGYALTHQQWGWAGTLASLPRGDCAASLEAVGCGRTAARIWELPLIDDRDPATSANDRLHHDVAVRRHTASQVSSPPPVEGADVHLLHRHQLALTPEDCELVKGLWVTKPLRTLLDLTSLITHEALVCAMDAALHSGKVKLHDLLPLAAERKGCEHAPAFSRAVAHTDGLAESPAETLARLILLPHLPGLRPQVKVYAPSGAVVARLDLADEELKLAVEPDGKRWHAGEVMAAKDRQRDATTGDLYGWWTERVTWYELRRRQEAFRRRVLARAAKRRLRLTPAVPTLGPVEQHSPDDQASRKAG